MTPDRRMAGAGLLRREGARGDDTPAAAAGAVDTTYDRVSEDSQTRVSEADDTRVTESAP